MENASKALIIAGAILLSILIIGLGMYIYNQASGAMSGSNLDPQKAAAHNGEFEAYFGDNVNGSNVRALVNSINAHNRQNTSDPSLQIQITNNTDFKAKAEAAKSDVTADQGNNPTTEKGAFNPTTYKAGESYKVTGGYLAKSGYLVGVNIVVNK